jgi:3-oxoacyl-(acyl-carrier-protein) synthase
MTPPAQSPDNSITKKRAYQNTKSSVAITGMGCISAAGTDTESHWININKGTACCSLVPDWLFSTKLHYPVFAAPPEALSPTGRDLFESASPSLLSSTLSRTLNLTVSAVAEALNQAGIGLQYLRGKKVGIALGTTVGCTFNNEDFYEQWRKGMKPDLAPIFHYLSGNLAQALHMILGTRGPSAVVTNACASGTDAIGIAKGWIASGTCDLAVAGGADELSRIAYNGFAGLQLSDTEQCRPFDRHRKGLNLGEGAGLLVLEEENQALERGITHLGWVRGYGSASDAWHPTAPHPEGRGLRCAFGQALADAGLSIQDVAMINAHGTGTKANDLAEANALSNLLPKSCHIAIVSTKGMTGHTLGAAGGLEAILTLLALQQGVTPGTHGYLSSDPQLPVNPIPQGISVPLPTRIGMSQSLAFGGGNAALVIEARP